VLVRRRGLAGLTAAFDLIAMARPSRSSRRATGVGGRVWTIREGFSDRQHAEAGGDMIDEAQTEIRDLAASLGLTLTRILRDGCAATCVPTSRVSRKSSPGVCSTAGNG